MDQTYIVSIYESVAQTTDQMLMAARSQDWDRLVELEACCGQYVEKLKMIDDCQLSGESRERKVASIKQILAADREIRNLVAPWMLKLNVMLNTNKNEKNLARTYRL